MPLGASTTEMPLGAMFPQTVMIGEKIYFGGGMMYGENAGQSAKVFKTSEDRKNDVDDDCFIVECSVAGRGPQWRKIVAPTAFFGMAAVDDQLIIAGGGDSNIESLSDQVFVLDDCKETCTQPFPAMPTARVLPSAIRLQEVAGCGWGRYSS